MAILGIGIDIIEINRIKNAAERSPKFVEKVFTIGEIDYFNSRNNNACHMAGVFAAKEAVLKAFGTGLRGVDFKEIEINRDALGKPYIILHGNGASLAGSMGVKNMHVSISHCQQYAVAEAVFEGD